MRVRIKFSCDTAGTYGPTTSLYRRLTSGAAKNSEADPGDGSRDARDSPASREIPLAKRDSLRDVRCDKCLESRAILSPKIQANSA